MDQRDLIAAHQQQCQTLRPAEEIHQRTQQKVNEFALAHQEKIVARIASAVDLARYRISYEFSVNSNQDVLKLVRSNLEAAGYKVSPSKHTQHDVWEISWSEPQMTISEVIAHNEKHL